MTNSVSVLDAAFLGRADQAGAITVEPATVAIRHSRRGEVCGRVGGDVVDCALQPLGSAVDPEQERCLFVSRRLVGAHLHLDGRRQDPDTRRLDQADIHLVEVIVP